MDSHPLLSTAALKSSRLCAMAGWPAQTANRTITSKGTFRCTGIMSMSPFLVWTLLYLCISTSHRYRNSGKCSNPRTDGTFPTIECKKMITQYLVLAALMAALCSAGQSQLVSLGQGAQKAAPGAEEDKR